MNAVGAEALASCLEEVAAMMRRIYERRLTTASGGNISQRLPGSPALIALTPGGGDKRATRADEIAVVDLEGNAQLAGRQATSEYQMHLAIYAACPDIHAIIHAHPPLASAFCCARSPIRTDLTAEGWAVAGRPVALPYALQGTPKLGRQCAKAAEQGARCMLLGNHGVTCVGRNLMEAFNRLEVLEHAAQLTLAVRQLDGVKHLDENQLQEIDAIYES